jgi:ribosomal protein S18 acetylase RimI-like enzyme
VPQLAAHAVPPSAEELAAIIASPATTVLLARDRDGAIVGTLTLVVVRIPTAVRAVIEDVVVDADARRAGVGEALTREAVRRARAAGARAVDLTSRPSREQANRLYRRLGFALRDTNAYRLSLGA